LRIDDRGGDDDADDTDTMHRSRRWDWRQWWRSNGGGAGAGGAGAYGGGDGGTPMVADSAGALYTVVDVALRLTDHDGSYELGAGGLHRDRVRQTTRWLRRALKALAALAALYLVYHVALRAPPSEYERMLAENNIVLLDARRARMKHYASAADAVTDVQLRSACAPLTDAGYRDYTPAAHGARRNLLVNNVLNMLREKALEHRSVDFLAPKFFDYFSDGAMRQRITDDADGSGGGAVGENGGGSGGGVVVVNPCIVVFRSFNDGQYYDMVNPLVIRDAALERHSQLDTRPTVALVSSAIFADVRDVERQRPAEIEINYLSPQNNYRAEVRILRGVDVHTFMEGYELLHAEAPPPSPSSSLVALPPAVAPEGDPRGGVGRMLGF
jgi:hypothetical protein